MVSTGGYSQLITQASDSDSAYIFFKDTSGERARLYSSTSNDLIFKTGGGSTTALTLNNSGNANFAGNVSVGNDLYVPNEIYHTGDTNTYLQFPAADQFRINTGGGNRLQVQNDKILVGDGVNMQYDGISTSNSGTVVRGGFLNPASEANMVHIPHIINDLAGFNKWSNATITTSGFYATRSGSSGSYTYSNEITNTNSGWANAFDAHSSTAGSWYSDNGSDGVYTHGTDTPGVVELQWTNEATYSLWAGIVFGSGSFTATYVKIEAYRGGAWQTLCEITNNTDQVILRQVGSNSGTGSATTRLKYTLGGSVNNSYFRIHSLYMVNYAAGNLNLNNTGTDTTRGVNFLERYKDGYLHGHFRPGAHNTYDIGSSSYKWKNIIGVNLHGDLVGTIHSSTTATTQSQGNNSTKVATTAYVDTAVSNLVDSAPSTLDTLNELAAALGDDANFSTTVTNSIAGKVSKSGDTMTGNLTIGSNTSGHDFLVYGNATGEKMFWDASESNLTINHDTDDAGLEIYTVGSASMTQPQLKVGRDNGQYWGVYTDDRNAHLVHRQDETSGIMTTRFDQWDSNTSDNTGQWQWRSGNGTGGSMTTAAVLYQDGDFTVKGDLMPITDGGGSLGKGSGTNLRWSGLELQSGAGIQWQNGDARIIEGLVNNYSLSFQTYDGSTGSTALRLDGDNTATFAGNLYLPEYIYHDGNTATYARFQTDRLTLNSGGGAIVDLHSNGQLYFTGISTFYNNIVSSGTIKAATSFIADAVSTSNNDPGTDNVQVSGYGIIGNRGNLYVTNANSSGLVQIGVGGVHNANPKLSINASSSTFTTDVRAPIFYDSNDTTYFLNPAGTGTALKVAGNVNAGGSILGQGNLNLRSYNNSGQGIFFRDGFEYGDSNPYNLSITIFNDGDGSSDALEINAYDGIYFNTGSGTQNIRAKIDNGGLATFYGDLDVGGLRIVGDNDSTDQAKPWIRSNGDYLVLNAVDGEHVYLNWDTSASGGSGHVKANGAMYATQFIDLDDTTYYLNPSNNSTSINVKGAVHWDLSSGQYSGDPRAVVTGYSGGNYGQIGYNIAFSTTSGAHTRVFNDIPTRIDLHNGIVVYASSAGSAGTSISWTEVLEAQTDAFQYKGQDIYHTGNNSSILNSNVTLASLGAAPSSTTTTANNALPKSGGTMTGDLVMQDEMINFAAGNPELPNFRGKRSNTRLNDRDWDTEGAWSYTTFENSTTDRPRDNLHNGNGLLTFNTHSGDGTNNYMHQMAFCTSPGTLHHRNRSGGSWGSWYEIAQTGRSLTGDLRATAYHDASNSAYYLDPAGTGTSLNVAGSINLLDNKMLMWGGNSIVKHTGSATEIGDNSSGSVLTIASGDADFTGNVEMQSGNSIGKFAVMSASVHGSYDFYNNGTSYFNGDVTVDANLTVTSGVANVTHAATDLLTLKNSTNGGGAGIVFDDHSSNAQKIYLRGYHGDGSSQGGGASLHLQSTETDLVFVVGDSSNTGRIAVQSVHSTAEVDYGFYSDTNTGIYSPAAGQVGIVSDSSRKLLVSSNGVTINNGSLYIPEYLYHADDTDTYMRFTNNTITFRAAGNDLFQVYRYPDTGGSGVTLGAFANNGLVAPNLGGANMIKKGTDIAVSTGYREEVTWADGTRKVQAHVSTGNGNSSACYQWYSSENIKVDPEKDYEFSVWIKSTGDDHLYLGWHEYRADGTKISSNPYFHTSKIKTHANTNNSNTLQPNIEGWVLLKYQLKSHRTTSGQSDTEGTDRYASNGNPYQTSGATGVMHSTTTHVHLRLGTCYGSVSGSKSYFYNPKITEAQNDDIDYIHKTAESCVKEKISVAQGKKILLDGRSGHTYITEESDSNLKFYVGGSEHINVGGGTIHLQKPVNIGDNELINNGATVFYNRTSPEIDYYDYSKLELLTDSVELHSPGEYIFSGADPYIFFKKPSAGAFLNGNQNVMKVGLIPSFGPGMEAVDTTSANLNTDLHFVIQKGGSQYEAIKITGKGDDTSKAQVYVKDNMSVSGKLGIGTTDPKNALSVSGVSSLNGEVLITQNKALIKRNCFFKTGGVRLQKSTSTNDELNMRYEGQNSNSFVIEQYVSGSKKGQIKFNGGSNALQLSATRLDIGSTSSGTTYLNSSTTNIPSGNILHFQDSRNFNDGLRFTHTGTGDIVQMGMYGSFGSERGWKMQVKTGGYEKEFIHINESANFIRLGQNISQIRVGAKFNIGETSTVRSTWEASVYGTTHMYFRNASLTSYPAAIFQHSGASGSTSATMVQFRTSSSNNVGRIVSSGSSTTYLTSSDYRMKKNFKDFDGINLVDQMSVYDFNWKVAYDSDQSQSYGVKAHELKEILPQAVWGEKDAVNEDGSVDPQGVDYSQLVPVLVKAVQELSAKVKDLESKLS